MFLATTARGMATSKLLAGLILWEPSWGHARGMGVLLLPALSCVPLDDGAVVQWHDRPSDYRLCDIGDGSGPAAGPKTGRNFSFSPEIQELLEEFAEQPTAEIAAPLKKQGGWSPFFGGTVMKALWSGEIPVIAKRPVGISGAASAIPGCSAFAYNQLIGL